MMEKVNVIIKNAMETCKQVWTYLNDLDQRTDISKRVLGWVMLNDDAGPRYMPMKMDRHGGNDLHLGVVALAGALCAVGVFFGAATLLIGLLP